LDNVHIDHQDTGTTTEIIRRLLRHALNAQFYLHGVRESYTLRFSPIGTDKTSDFPLDEEWMQAANALEVPPTRRNQPREPLPPVQLVTQPMLVSSGLDGLNFDRKFSLVNHMRVVTPWTFGGPDAEEFILPGFEKGWQFLCHARLGFHEGSTVGTSYFVPVSRSAPHQILPPWT
jgi:hypothetical protein